ncbi:hypothetical protein BDZ45DRAFT_692265 [Acephala macrosclerotiorum]|nr:hypothetical protein BDZ45DRAFT_692265 [Acephala macrosclerotiorum]
MLSQPRSCGDEDCEICYCSRLTQGRARGSDLQVKAAIAQVQRRKWISVRPVSVTDYDGDKRRKESRRVIRGFLERHKGGFWGDIKWKRPIVAHSGLCVKSMQTSHCPDLGLGRAKAKRDVEATEILAAGQGVMKSSEGVGPSKSESKVEENISEGDD